jgi:hypothetical protein
MQARIGDQRGYKSRPIGYAGTSTWTTARQVQARPEHDLFITYPKEVQGDLPAMWQRRVPDAPGLSGGGIWRPAWASPDWSPASARLVGIQRSWSPDARWLRGTLILDWLHMLRDDHAELAGEIDAMLSGQEHAPELIR